MRRRIGKASLFAAFLFGGVLAVSPSIRADLAVWGGNIYIDASQIISGIVPVANGGTGASSLTNHGVVVGSGTAAVDVTSAGTAGQPLLSGGASADPNWGTLSVEFGGTEATSLTDHGVLLGSGTDAVTPTAVGTNGQMLLGQTAADPTWNTMSGDGTLSNAGVLAVTKVNGVTISGTPSTGYVPTATGADTATWQAAASTGGLLGYAARSYRVIDLTAMAFTALGLPAGTLSCTATAAVSSIGSVPAVSCDISSSGDVFQLISSQLIANFGIVKVQARAFVFTGSSTVNIRRWEVAVTESNALATNDTVTADFIGIRYSTGAGDTNYQCCSADGTTASCSDMGVAFTATAGRIAAIEWENGAYYCKLYNTTTEALVVSTQKTLNLPATGQSGYLFHSAKSLAAITGTSQRLAYLTITP